ncbi:MAG: outer membrane protein assembly factor BamE [Deltaproteobacteria bacterium]|jgi:outer membrane protein assembly factor BamE (lipoprotein component of BamABCDE complex)|nr:outer membrane protein assembly factor BamE [Deltaproteobacteria bacterium]
MRKSYVGTTSALILLLALSSCQTPRYKEFEDVHTGMTKAEVIEVVGGPSAKRRRQGVDRWTYIFENHPDGEQVREVHFVDGKSTYVGTQIKSVVSPEIQDKINETKSRVLDEKERIGTGSAKSEDVEVFIPVEAD